MPTLTKKRADLSQLGSIGLEQSLGIVNDETTRDLQGLKAFKAYREIADNSAVAGACLLAIEMLLRKVKWTVEPGEQAGEEERCKRIDESRNDMSVSWEDTVSEWLSMIVYGFHYSEIVYKQCKGPDETSGRFRSKFSDGLIMWRKFVPIPAETLERWEFDDEGGIQGFWQRSPPNFDLVFIPIEKSLLFRTRINKNNPQGRSLLRNAYFPWRMVKTIMEIEAIGIERDLAGLPVALVPPELLDKNATTEDAALLVAIKNLVTNIRRNAQEGIVFPMSYDDENNPMYELKLLATGGMRQFDTNKIIERYERRIAMSMLSDFIMMGHERVGSLALSRDKTTLIGRALAGLLQSIAAVLNMHAIPRLYRLNNWPMESPCKLVPGDLENFDIKNLGAYVRGLVQVGAITPDPNLETELRELAGLPKIDPEYELTREERLLPNQLPPEGYDANGDPLPPDPMAGDGADAENPDGAPPPKKRPGGPRPGAKRPAGKPAPKKPAQPRKSLRAQIEELTEEIRKPSGNA